MKTYYSEILRRVRRTQVIITVQRTCRGEVCEAEKKIRMVQKDITN